MREMRWLPDEALENVADDEVALSDDDEESNVCPGKQWKLLHVVALDEGEDKPDEADDVQSERDESVILDEGP